MLEGCAVSGQDYADCLSELVNICVLCNDSGLAYNEVCDTCDKEEAIIDSFAIPFPQGANIPVAPLK